MDDLHHGRAFVAASRLAGKHSDARWCSAGGRQIACCLAQRKVGYTVRKHTNLQPRSVHAEGAARIKGAVRQVAFRGYAALSGLYRGLHHGRQAGSYSRGPGHEVAAQVVPAAMGPRFPLGRDEDHLRKSGNAFHLHSGNDGPHAAHTRIRTQHLSAGRGQLFE